MVLSTHKMTQIIAQYTCIHVRMSVHVWSPVHDLMSVGVGVMAGELYKVMCFTARCLL